MSIRDALAEYIAVRRALGSKLQESGIYHYKPRLPLGNQTRACAARDVGPTAFHGETVRHVGLDF